MRKQFGMELRLQKTDYILYIDSDGQIGPNQFDEMWRRRSENLFLMGWRYPRLDPPVRLSYSKLFKFFHGVRFPNRLHDRGVGGRATVFDYIMVFSSDGPLVNDGGPKAKP